MRLTINRDSWKNNSVTESGFLGKSTLTLINSIFGDIILDCVQIVDEKKSNSLRLSLYENSLVKLCSEFNVNPPQNVPPSCNDSVYQIIPMGLFSETFSPANTASDNITEIVMDECEETKSLSEIIKIDASDPTMQNSEPHLTCRGKLETFVEMILKMDFSVALNELFKRHF